MGPLYVNSNSKTNQGSVPQETTDQRLSNPYIRKINFAWDDLKTSSWIQFQIPFFVYIKI